jgi:hypothetical protein
MNNPPLVSDLVAAVCRTFRPYEHSGVQVQPKAVSTLLRNLRTIQELAREQEQELEIQAEMLRINACRQAVREERIEKWADNVVRLPTRLRSVALPPDGGDVA